MPWLLAARVLLLALLASLVVAFMWHAADGRDR